MTPATLTRIGHALYGPEWFGPMAVALDIRKDSVRHWASGHSPIPDSVRPELMKLLNRRAVECGLLFNELKEET